jgi:hypothetical protein
MGTIELKYEDLSSEAFTNALMTLARSRMREARFALAVSDMIDEVNVARQKISEHYKNEVISAYAEKDENGEVKFNGEGRYDIAKEKYEDYEKANKEFGQNKITLNRGKLPLAWVSSAAGLSAADMSHLKKLIEVETSNQQQLELPFGGQI